ncbi:hypothetical protein EJ06DRAFT_510996 [Trichodelitschia bisporula]|uniref:N-acetyltransferase domain-containing protein n=1 Tax=Trichodelitschia bisporula TaxID=703511 RepID=A0A6G1HV22_9PEZI|nr:hypothetical protein EJ06DRAFT_510996 [Trichodelitschia bisporula]
MMPAVLDDPTAPPIYRTSGEAPYPTPFSPLPPDVTPRQVTLRDRVTVATLIPFSSPRQVPFSLLAYLCDQLNREIEKGDTYPMIEPFALEAFGSYWFANFAAVMLLGSIESAEEVQELEARGHDWDKGCLGSFYIKPNYPGRSSHVCNGGFLVTDGARNRGVGRLMGEGYLEWAPKLGYIYSVFNLVYETNVASCRIWDALGFKRIGRVKGCGNLRSSPDQLVDAIIFGRDLGPEGEDYVSEERFEKIKFYLKHGKYPNGADRAEKSRLRSAATHYKLLPATDTEPEKLMLKGKEVVADPQKQYEVARKIHLHNHGGINKTTAAIAEKYHWVRIKETVGLVIRNCPDCKDVSKAPAQRPEGSGRRSDASLSQPTADKPERAFSVPPPQSDQLPISPENYSIGSEPPNMHQPHSQPQPQHIAPVTSMGPVTNYQIPVDPRIMDGMEPSYADFMQPSQSSISQYGSAVLKKQLPSHIPGGSGRPSQMVPHGHHQPLITGPTDIFSAASMPPSGMNRGRGRVSDEEMLRQRLMNEGYGPEG